MRSYIGAVLGLLLAFPSVGAAQEVRLSAPEADDALLSVLRAASLTLSLPSDPDAVRQDYIAAARADYTRLLTGLYAEGYYGGVVSILMNGREAAAIDPLSPPQQIDTVELRVAPGPRFAFGQIRIAPLAPDTELPDGFAPGQTARSDIIRDATEVALDGWRAQGYALATPSGQQIIADHPQETLDVAVTITPGQILSYGTIGVLGAQNVREDRVREIAGILPGQRFNPEELARAEANLRRVEVFNSATILEGETATQDGRLPLDIQVVERAPRRIGFGAEYSSIKGLTLSGFWMHRNLLGGAERFRTEAEVTGLSGGNAGVDYTIETSYLRPATFRSDVDLYADIAIEQLDEPSYFTRQARAEAGLIRRVRDLAVIEAGIGYRAGKTRDDLGERSYEMLTFPLAGTRDTRDNPIDATEGYFVSLELTPFVGTQGVDNGARVDGDFRYYRSLLDQDRLTFAIRGQVGAVVGADAQNVPSDFLFYSGGGGSVRGQPFQSLGVDLGGGLEIGGRHFVGIQSEARIAVGENLGLVGFADTGFIGDTAFSFNNGTWHSGAGVGVRYDTGIGPIRFDIATPISGDDAGKRVEFYIGVGQAF